jgi:predicted amidohydrolase
MAENETTRRGMITGSMALAGAMIAAGKTQPLLAQNASTPPAPASGSIKPFAAAVMRTPVIVPQTKDSLPDVRRRNAEAMVASIEAAMRGPTPPRLIVFPVLQFVSAQRGVSGVPITDVAVDLTAAPLDQSIFAPVIAACRRHDCYVVTSTQEKTARLPGRYFHTGFVMGPEGLVLRSPKTQAKSAPEISYLRDIKDEYIAAFGPDSILPVARTPIGTIGCYIEAEVEVFEASRMLASRGADIIVHPSLEDDTTPWAALKQAVAYQCQVYLLTGATSRNIKKEDPTGGWCGGAATIVGPDGRILASKGGHDEGAATAMLDLDAIKAARAANGFKTTPAKTLYTKLYS